jgi:hypothetical protein
MTHDPKWISIDRRTWMTALRAGVVMGAFVSVLIAFVVAVAML